MNTAEQIRTLLEAAFAPQALSIQDDSAQHAGHAGAASGGGHYTVAITAQAFSGKSRVMRHRMVYDAVRPLMQQAIHAMAIQAKSPEETQA